MRFTLWRTVARPQSLNPNLSRAHALTRSRALELGLSALEALEVRLLRVHQRLEPLCSILVPFTPRDLRERGVPARNRMDSGGGGQRSKLAEKGRSGLEVARDTRAEERETAREAGGRV
mmetsp:Transcript_26083/g.62005  ORF Transcript_26083/g.62005 Transcript_26083/m.62005 type:complete len:119 (+) Transcript_26083:86-442(+)